MNGPLRPRKRFGQHFLTSSETLGRLVDAIAPAAGDRILEIGPGRGALTFPLAESGVDLLAIEFDRDLASLLRRQMADRRNVTILEADALTFDYAAAGTRLRVVGNLPYNISTPLLFRLIEFRDSLLDLHLMLQREVVDRLCAAPRTAAYGRLTVMAGVWMQVEKLFEVPPEAFTPPPRVVSAVARIEPRSTRLNVTDAALLRDVVTKAFGQRRKTLRNALKVVADARELESLGIDPGARAEEIAVDTWIAFANGLHARRGNGESPSHQ